MFVNFIKAVNWYIAMVLLNATRIWYVDKYCEVLCRLAGALSYLGGLCQLVIGSIIYMTSHVSAAVRKHVSSLVNGA